MNNKKLKLARSRIDKLDKSIFNLFGKIKSFKRGVAICEGQGLIKKEIACKAEFSLILPEEIKKYNLKK